MCGISVVVERGSLLNSADLKWSEGSNPSCRAREAIKPTCQYQLLRHQQVKPYCKNDGKALPTNCGLSAQKQPSAKEFLIFLSVRNVLWATFVIMSYKYDVQIGNKDMRFSVIAHHIIGSITSALSRWQLGSDVALRCQRGQNAIAHLPCVKRAEKLFYNFVTMRWRNR